MKSRPSAPPVATEPTLTDYAESPSRREQKGSERGVSVVGLSQPRFDRTASQGQFRRETRASKTVPKENSCTEADDLGCSGRAQRRSLRLTGKNSAKSAEFFGCRSYPSKRGESDVRPAAILSQSSAAL